MSIAISRPLSIAEVLDQGFRLFQKAFLRVLPLTLMWSVLSMAPLAVRIASGDIKTNHYGLASGLTQFVAYILVFFFLIAVLRRLDDILRDRNQLTLGSALSGGLRYGFPLFLASLAYMLVIMLGTVLLVVPGLYLMVSLSMFIFCVVLDGAGITESLQRSRELVRGHWWRVTTIGTVAILIFVAVYMALVAIVGLLMPFLKGIVLVSGGQNAIVMFTVAVSVLMLFTGAVLNPLIYSIGLVTYRELQLRKSGEDLAARIEQAA